MKQSAGIIGKRFFFFVVAAIFLATLCGCGPLDDSSATDSDSASVLTDDFTDYETFPQTPWAVIKGSESGWTIESESDDKAARFNASAADSSYLLNANYSGSGNVSVSGKMKIVSMAETGGNYGFYLRASSDLSSCYSLIFDGANGKIHICKLSDMFSILKSADWSVSSAMTDYHTYTFKLITNSDSAATLSAYVDNNLMATVTDASPLASSFYTGFFFNNILDGYISRYQIGEP